MAQNLYVQLANVKTDLGISGTTNDAALLRLIERMSRAVDDYCNRHFYSVWATRYYNGNGCRELWLPDDLLTVGTLKVDDDGDGTYDVTLVVTTDYWLYPDNKTPKNRLDLNPDGTQLSAWTKARKSVELAASLFGYSNETEDTGQTVQNTTQISDTGTSLQVTSSAGISVGETLLMGTEQVYASAIPDATHVTIVRGLNGSTAAAHLNGVVIYRRRYPGAIEEAVTMQVSRFWNEQKTGYSGQAAAAEVGGFSFSTLYPAIRDLLNPYRVQVVG